jgi:S1-C subfamily serine protease
MSVKSKQFKLRNVKPSLSLLVISVLLLLAVPRLTSWVMQKLGKQAELQDPQFELAYQSVRELGNTAIGYAGLGGFNSYGINQLDYDRWRQLNGKSVKDLVDITDEEVRAIYQLHWQNGDCQRYPSPLDIACLDSVVSFGVPQSKLLLANLPPDPTEAALEVVSRRELFRHQQVRPPITPGKQLAIREGLRRDRALADLVVDVPSVAPASPSPAELPSPASTLSAEQIYRMLKPSTVEVWNSNQQGIASTAAGVILSANGLILTNHHVVERNPSPHVKLADGRKFQGRVISIDADLDLALIQLDRANGLPVASFAMNTDQVKVGDTVHAIGSPRGDSWKMSTSRVIELNSTCANGVSPLRCIRTPGGFLQPGNSGGPLINTAGQVIGINRAVQQTTGEGVSIPIETVQNFLDQRMGQPSQMEQTVKRPRRWL